MTNKLHFKISSALKDIIGRDLITDDFIAIFELVKNSFDAYATQVDIYFEGIYTDNPKIIIKDNGKGMNINDLNNKWLFVAYSAKREGTEDDSYDYRNKIDRNRPFAGLKGIGRFSCDKLGRFLLLETTKDEPNSQTEVLYTNWENFEGNIQEEFIDISVLHETKSKSDYNLNHGTLLEISGLRNEWDRAKILKLKSSLARLINPYKGAKDQAFKIILCVPEELQNDILVSPEYLNEVKYEINRQIVNGEIRNFIFETLGLKTTKIFSSISEDGKFISTELKDGGTLIYKITEKNKYILLDNIDFTLYYLNRSAKITFGKKMGIASHKYGHVFLYKSGFRIFPYGESGEDPLRIDVRKAQGVRRFFGTRELIGQIEIFSNTDQLKETTSRGDGLIKTNTYLQLEECFWDVLRRLEKYVVDVQGWGLSVEDDSADMNSRIADFIAKLTDSDGIIDFEYNENIFEIIEESQSRSADTLLDNLNKIASESGNKKLLEAAKKASQKLKEIKRAKDEAEEEANRAKKKIKEVESELEVTIKQNLLLKEATNEDTVEILSIEHHINQATYRVNNLLQKLIIGIKNRANINDVILIANRISLENKKISSLVNFVRKAKFDTMSATLIGDLINYIEEYIENIYKEDHIKIINKQLIEVEVKYDHNLTFITEFVPLEINIILDNMLDNSFKASATKAEIILSVPKPRLLEMLYRDNGIGIKEENIEKVFNFGYSTTGGSGIGLYHIKYLMENQHYGDVSINNNFKTGTEFILLFNKKNI